MNGEQRLVWLTKVLVVVAVVSVAIGVLQLTAWGDTLPTITVDGVEYQATKVTPGGTVHFETPDTDPSEAFTDRHVWEGHGSENLPCEGGIHWIDNANVLTVSHCLAVTTTTTTVPEVTTTTEPESGSTTTSVISDTTTTEPTTTTSGSDTPTTTVTSPATTTTTTPSSSEPELPFTGVTLELVPFALMLIGAGVGLVRRFRLDQSA